MAVSRLTKLRTTRAPQLRAPPRQVLALCSAIGVFTVIAVVGDLLSPVLLLHHPVALLLLTPRTAYLVAVAHNIPFAAFLLVSVVRLGAADPLHFMLGRRLSRRPPARARALWLVAVAVSPTGKTMLVAGATGQSRWPVATANLVGTLVRVLVIWRVGEAFPTVGETAASLAPWFAIPGCIGLVVAVLKWRCGARPALARAGAISRGAARPAAAA
jgi:hypothetical protein